jgi:YfiH family protein
MTTVDSFGEALAGAACSFGGSALPAAVARSVGALAGVLELAPARLQFLTQVHGCGVVRVGAASAPQEADAMLTDEPDLALCVRLADCGGAVLFDPDHGALAAVHSGWRGTRANILAATVAAMRAQFGTEPRRLLAYLAPCASAARYEVGDEFAGWFPEHVARHGARLHFDNQAAMTAQLRACGVPPNNLEIDTRCTIADRRFHSHRRDGAAAGRNCLFAVRRADVGFALHSAPRAH